MPTISSKLPQNMTDYLNPVGLAKNLWCHRDLIRQFTRREIEGRYSGSYLGVFWSFVTPLVMLSIYTFVFGIVFKARWQGTRGSSLEEFALVIFCGLTAFNIFGECASRAGSLIVGVPNYVKRVIFPLEILPVSVLGSSLFHATISLLILLLGNLLTGGSLSWTVLLLPVVSLPLIFLSLGASWFLAGLGVFVRDVNHSVTLIVQVLFFVTPIFYSIEIIPEPFRTIIKFNPLTAVVENFRRVILWGVPPIWGSWVAWIILTSLLVLLGYAWFMKTKKGFADVL
jgi:lipopolysaccharide transport system permease protein